MMSDSERIHKDSESEMESIDEVSNADLGDVTVNDTTVDQIEQNLLEQESDDFVVNTPQLLRTNGFPQQIPKRDNIIPTTSKTTRTGNGNGIRGKF